MNRMVPPNLYPCYSLASFIRIPFSNFPQENSPNILAPSTKQTKLIPSPSLKNEKLIKIKTSVLELLGNNK